MTEPAPAIEIVPFEDAHLDGALRLSREAQWPHRKEDWAFVMALSDGVAALRDGVVVGTGFCTPFGAHTAASNLIIVDAAMRGQGLGRRLMDCLLAMAGERENRLVATDDGLDLYRKLGFRAVGPVRQHQATIAKVAGPDGVSWWPDPERAHLAKLDRAAFGADRTGVIDALCDVGEVAIVDGPSDPPGFAVVRPFGKGRVVGPVIARSPAEAKALIAFCLAAHPDTFMRVDVPEDTQLGPWLEDLGLPQVGGGLAMVRGARPMLVTEEKVFALVNQALG
ncbi:MAG: GNAT family N-acetyltransferase [Pseudomonadota bacterium]